jgi:hypothetical protein
MDNSVLYKTKRRRKKNVREIPKALFSCHASTLDFPFSYVLDSNTLLIQIRVNSQISNVTSFHTNGYKVVIKKCCSTYFG